MRPLETPKDVAARMFPDGTMNAVVRRATSTIAIREDRRVIAEAMGPLADKIANASQDDYTAGLVRAFARALRGEP